MADTASVTLNFASGDDLKFQLDYLCQHIHNPDRRLRQNALQRLLDHCDPAFIGHLLAAQQAADVFSVMYIPLIRCYSDRYEQCRTLAIGIISALIGQMPTNTFYVDSIVPVISRRIGQPEIVEPSEEVRLLLLQQLLAIIRRFDGSRPSTVNDQLSVINENHDTFVHCHNNIMDVLVKTLSDPYPVIQRTCCECIDALATASPICFPSRAENLLNSLISLLDHRHSSTRLAAVRALGTVVLHLRNSDDIVRCIVALSPLLMDDKALVRLQCGRVGCRWILELRDRYSFFERLIPFPLCGLNDSCAENRLEISSLWKICGEQYYRENEQEISRIELVDRRPERYPLEVERPSLGCRLIVQRSLRVCTIVCKEMTDWKDNVRVHSLRLLWQIVLHSESTLTAKFIDIYPLLMRYSVDPVREVSENALSCAGLLGKLLKYNDWIDHALAGLRKAPHLSQLKCFATMFNEASGAERNLHLRSICEIIVDQSVLRNMQAEYQDTLITLLETLLDIYKSSEHSVVEQMSELAISTKSIQELLYMVLTEVRAMCENGAENNKGRLLRLDRLLDILADGNISQLHTKYLPNLLRSIHDDFEAMNSETSEPILLLHGIVRFVGFQPETLHAISEAIRLCMHNATNCGRIKILSAVSFSMLTWSRTMDQPSIPDYSVKALREFLADHIEPILVWQAGRNAEVLRTMATAVLRSASTGADREVEIIFPQLAHQWIALLDDNSVVTRAYALGCLLKCGPLQLEALKSIALAVLARLDDPSGEVRELAVTVLPLLRLFDNARDNEHDSWEVVLKHLMSTMILHLDCPELKLRNLVARALVILGRAHRNVADLVLLDLPVTVYKKYSIESIRSEIYAKVND